MGSSVAAKRVNGHLGVTEPISLSGPTEIDVIKTQELEKFLEDAGLYEKQDEAVSREEVLGRLDQIVKMWVKRISRAKGFNEQFVQEANAKIFTFGSYRLGVHGPGADIDTLCVGPRHATREEDFFTELHNMLAEMPEVTELHPVPDAHVPVMKFNFCGVSIDLLYAKLALWVIPEAMEATKAEWSTLFEPYPFFESYKNYLEIDITAANEDDLRKWKGWVESRLRILTLKIEKHTFGMLQCHPYPNNFSDKSKTFHCCYFMGLQRKQGVRVHEGGQFDIRATVEEFKQSVNMYTLWKPEMEIQVSHIKRRNIPHFVFPGGIKPLRSLKPARKPSKPIETNCGINGENVFEVVPDEDDKQMCTEEISYSNGHLFEVSESLDSTSEARKRKQMEDASESNSDDAKRPFLHPNKLSESVRELEQLETGSVNQQPSEEAEELAIKNIFGSPSTAIADFPEELDEYELQKQDKCLEEADNGFPARSTQTQNTQCEVISNGSLEELEPVELSAPSFSEPPAATTQRRPLIRISFSSVARETGRNT